MVQRVKAPSLIDVLLVDFPRSTVDGLKVRGLRSERLVTGGPPEPVAFDVEPFLQSTHSPGLRLRLDWSTPTSMTEVTIQY